MQKIAIALFGGSEVEGYSAPAGASGGSPSQRR